MPRSAPVALLSLLAAAGPALAQDDSCFTQNANLMAENINNGFETLAGSAAECQGRPGFLWGLKSLLVEHSYASARAYGIGTYDARSVCILYTA